MNEQGADLILERMMQLHPKVMDLTLDRVWRLLDKLGNPHHKVPPVIHIAGTNGKGSTQAMVRAGMEAAGKRVHAYTSPHLVRFNERIRLAGELISESALTDVLNECYQANDGDQITYFEITTCAALLAFSRCEADYTLMEVGLGGRLDATNVFETPEITAITPVSIDHQQFLGETLEEIAAEKAGILKRGVRCVVARQQEPALQVIESIAHKTRAPLTTCGEHWQVWAENGRLIYQDERGLLDLPLPKLPGAHQIENAGTALTILRTLGFNETACEGAMINATWPARLQRLRHGPLIEAAGEAEIWLDGGHNTAAGHALGQHLATLPKRPTYAICGMLNSKDVEGYMRPLSQHIEALVGISIPNEKNALSAEEIALCAANSGISSRTEKSSKAAFSWILQQHPAPRIVICGSLYLAGTILAQNG